MFAVVRLAEVEVYRSTPDHSTVRAASAEGPFTSKEAALASLTQYDGPDTTPLVEDEFGRLCVDGSPVYQIVPFHVLS